MDAKPIDTPMGTNSKLEADEPGPTVNTTIYRVIIGSLMYLTANRPDIIFSVGMCARFQACLRESYLKATKRIIRYLKVTKRLSLFYPTGDSFDLVGYVDSDFIGYHFNQKSTSRMAHFLGSSLIS